MQRLRPSGENGAVAVLVAILAVVLFGMAALVIDVGAVYAERRQLQNGADAAALAVALGCAKNLATCGDLSGSLAQALANANANDGETVSQVVSIGGNNVTIRTSTLNDGSTLLPPVFGQVLLGDSYSGTEVDAAATAEWGFPSSTRVSPLGIAQCEFDRRKEAGFAAFEPERIEWGGSAECQDESLESGFRWMRRRCDRQATYRVGEVQRVRSRSGCAAMLDDHRTSGEPILVPLYEPAGSDRTRVTVSGFAAFVVTDFSDDDDEDDWIYGDFVFFTTDIGEGGGPDNWLAVVRLID